MEKAGMELEKKDLIPVNSITSEGGNHKETKNDRHKWIASLEYILEYILKNEESEQATRLIEELTERLRESGVVVSAAQKVSQGRERIASAGRLRVGDGQIVVQEVGSGAESMRSGLV